MRIAWNNYITDSIMTASSSLENRSVDDLKIPHLARSFSFGAPSGDIVIEFPEDRQVTCFVLGGTNLKDGDLILLQGNHTNEWSGPAFSEDVNYYQGNQLLFLDRTYKFWKISVSSSVDMVSIGHILIGGYLQMPGIAPDYDHYFNRTDTVSLSGGLQPFGDVGVPHFSCKFTFFNIKDSAEIIRGVQVATRKEILEMWNSIGSVTPVYMCIWEKDLDIVPPIFGILNQSTVKMSRDDKYKSYKTEINFQETK